MSKSNKIIPVFIFQVLQLPDPWPEDPPQYHFRSGPVTRHPPEIFLPCHQFLNGRNWAKTIRKPLYSSCRYFSCPTHARKMDHTIISDPAQSLAIHLKYFLPAINFLIAGNGHT